MLADEHRCHDSTHRAGAPSSAGAPALCPSSRGADLSPGWTLSNLLSVGNDERL